MPISQPPQHLIDEHAASFGDPDLTVLKKIGFQSTFTCPDCSGALFELTDRKPLRYTFAIPDMHTPLAH